MGFSNVGEDGDDCGTRSGCYCLVDLLGRSGLLKGEHWLDVHVQALLKSVHRSRRRGQSIGFYEHVQAPVLKSVHSPHRGQSIGFYEHVQAPVLKSVHSPHRGQNGIKLEHQVVLSTQVSAAGRDGPSAGVFPSPGTRLESCAWPLISGRGSPFLCACLTTVVSGHDP